jgi:two-component system, LytTR family, response regulator
MLKALIVDDEELARRGLELRLEKFEDIEICAQSRNGREALLAVREHAPDIMFLDVQMPGMDGFDVLRSLSTSNMPAVIFVTAYDEFALKAFDANALDYLLKPINDDRLAEAIERARRDSDEKQANEHRSKLLKFVCDLTGQELSLEAALQAATGDGQRFPKRLAIRNGAETTCIDVDAIDWIDAAGDYMCVHSGGDTHVLRGTMKHLEKLLNPEVFVRVHRSAIVNRHRIRSMRPHRNGEYFLNLGGDTELKLSRKYKRNVDRIAHRSS